MKCALRLALRRSRIALQRDANEPMRNTHILAYDGCRHALLPLFRLADESEAHIRSYYKIGHVLVARMEGSIIGMVQISEEEETAEIVSLAVIPERQQQGVGTLLLQEAANHSRGGSIRRGGSRRARSRSAEPRRTTTRGRARRAGGVARAGAR